VSKIHMPCPRDQIDFLSTRPSYGLAPKRSRAQQEVRKTLFDLESEILKPRWLPTSCADVREIARIHLDEVRVKLADLARLEGILAETISRCSGDPAPHLPC
jgi:hypothetical protein